MSLELEFRCIKKIVDDTEEMLEEVINRFGSLKDNINDICRSSYKVPKTADEIEAELREDISTRIASNTREEIINKMVKVLVNIEVHKIITEYDRKMYDAQRFDVFDCVSKAITYIRDAMIKEITSNQ